MSVQFVTLKEESVQAISNNNLESDRIFAAAKDRFRPEDLEAGDRDNLLKKAMKKLEGKLDAADLEGSVGKVVKKAEKLARKAGGDADDEDDEQADLKKLPPAWKRHTIVAGFGAAAAYFSTIPSQSMTSLFFTLGFLKLSKSYMIGFSRIRRYLALGAIVGGAVVLKSFWNDVNLTPLAAGLGIDALVFTAKAYMKGKLKKDEGPEETNRALLCLQNGIAKSCDAIGSCVDGAAAKAAKCFGWLTSCCKRSS